MGITHPSNIYTTILMAGKEWGFAAFLSLGGTSGSKAVLPLLDQVKASQSFLG